MIPEGYGDDVSVFGRAPGGGLSSVVREAVADQISASFGDDDTDDLDVLEDSEDFGGLDDPDDSDDFDDIDDFGVEDEIDEIFGDDDSFGEYDEEFDLDDLEDESDEVDESDEDDDSVDGVLVSAPSYSKRVAAADQERFGFNLGRQGFKQEKQSTKQAKLVTKQAKSATKQAKFDAMQSRQQMIQGSPLGQALSSAAEAMVSSQAGGAPVAPGSAVPWWQHLVQASAPAATPSDVSPPVSEPQDGQVTAVPEAGSETLPPVYVADQVEPTEDVTIGEPTTVKTATMFGAAVDEWAAKQTRPGARKGVINAIGLGMGSMVGLPYGDPSSFVEDPHVKPLLMRDGQIIDQVYGELAAVPCPSCSRVSRARVESCKACSVCDGFGAILLPVGDLPSYGSSESYGFFPLLIPIIGAAAGAAATAGTGMFAAKSQEVRARRAQDADERKIGAMQRLVTQRNQAIAKRDAGKLAVPKGAVAAGGAARQEVAGLVEEFGDVDWDETRWYLDDFGADDDLEDLEDDPDDDVGFGELDDDLGDDLDDDPDSSVDFDDDELDGDEDFDGESSSRVTYGMVRVMIPDRPGRR